MAERFDLVVIGAGPGGYVAAIRAAQLGMKVACVEKRATLGGTCLNVGCIPSKALLDASEWFEQAQCRFDKYGIKVSSVELDLGQMMQRKEEIVKSLCDGVAFLFKKNRITSINGTGKIAAPGKVSVRTLEGKTQEVEAKAILLATGSEPAVLPSLPFDGTYIVNSTEALQFEKVPSHLIVVGGGYIGLELGSVWSRLGAKVTVLEFLPRILPQIDGDMARFLQRFLTRQGFTFHMETRVTGASVQGGEVIVNAQSKGEGQIFKGDKVLVAVGRKPCTAGLGLEEIGVALDEKSKRVLVDKKFETNIPGVYAIGDITEGPMLAHKASEEGVAFAEGLAKKASSVNHDLIPSVIFTHPELASVGPTEEELKESGKEYKVGKFPFSAIGKAKSLDATDGMVKILADAKTDRVLAAHILGPHASDLIAEIVLAMEFGASAEDIARTCHAHPTLSEAVAEAARGAWDTVLHG